MMMPGLSMQEMNDPTNYRYQNDGQFAGGIFAPAEDQDDGFNEEGSFNFEEPHTPVGHRQSSPFGKGINQSPNKTGGQIELRELQNDDLAHEAFLGRDAAIVIEGEMRQFDSKKVDKVQRFVESLVTGNFMKVQKDINLQIQSQDINDKNKKVQSSREFYEREMKEAQRMWVNRVNKLFNLFIGLLGGMSLMHLIVLLNQPDKTSFLQLYSKICTTINIVFMIFTSFALILGLSLTMIYREKSDEKMRNMDPYRLEFRQHYIVSLVMTLLMLICLILIYILPHFSNKIYYWSAQSITDNDVMIAKAIFGAINVLFIIAWCLATAFNKASINDIDLDPEDLDDNDTLENQSMIE